MKDKYISKCCKAELIVISSQDFIGDRNDPDRVGTCYYECSECGKPCDIIGRKKK